ncbi:hypothetical protein D3C80_1663260 [compost metagenome]
MALDTASTPVKAEQPELNAFSSRNRLTLDTAEPISGTLAWAPPVRYLNTPATIRKKIEPTNKYTGIAIKEADSVTPRKLTIVSNIMTDTAISTE